MSSLTRLRFFVATTVGVARIVAFVSIGFNDSLLKDETHVQGKQ